MAVQDNHLYGDREGLVDNWPTSRDDDQRLALRCSFGSVRSDTMVKISPASEPVLCFCEKCGEGEFVCGWEPRNPKNLLRTPEKQSKKMSLASNASTSSTASSHWSNVRNNIPNLRPWTNKNKEAKGEQDTGTKDYFFRHLSSTEDYITDYRKNHVVRVPSSASCSSLSIVDGPDPYMNKLKNYRDLYEKLKTLSQQDRPHKTRVLTPSVIRDKATPDFVHCRTDVRGLGSPTERIQSLSLGLYSQRLSPKSQALSQKQAIANAVQMVNLARCRSERAKSPSTASESSDGSRDAYSETVESKDCVSETGWATVTEQTTAIETGRQQTIQSRTNILEETSIPIADIHFGVAPAKGKTWSSGSGQYMNLSFPKTTFPVPVRVTNTPPVSYSMDNKRIANSPRSRLRESIQLTPTGRQGMTRGSREKCPRKFRNGINVGEGRRRLHSDSSTAKSPFNNRIHNKTSVSLGTLNQKIFT